MVSKCGKNKKVANKAKLSLSLVFLVHFDVICDLSLNRHVVTWNLFVLHDKKVLIMVKSSMHLHSNRS